MALGDPYAAPSELEDRLGTTDTGGHYGVLLDAASRAVESFTGRQFNKTVTATARSYRAVDRLRLPVDDFHTITDLAIVVDGTAWAVTDVDPRPWSGVVNGQEGWPFFDLFAVDRTWPWSRRGKIDVTAQWGWAAVPAPIREATLDVAAMLVSNPASTAVQSERVGDYSVSYYPSSGSVATSPELQRAIPYRLRKFGVA